MAGDVFGITLSFVFVFALIGTASLLRRFTPIRGNASRKIIHIGVSHWWLLAACFISSLAGAVIGPIVFIVINYASYRYNLFPAMNPSGEGNNLGTVYYPISLLVLVILSWGGLVPKYVGGLGILILGWGDGVAAVVGESLSSPALFFGNRRTSLAGSAAMLLASFTVALVVLRPALGEMGAGVVAGRALVVAVAAAGLEGFTSGGTDNLTVPLGTVGLYWLLFL